MSNETQKPKPFAPVITYSRTKFGYYRIVLIMDGKEYVYRRLLSEEQALQFIKDANKQGVPFQPPPSLKVKNEKAKT